jgi:hypothetical protein
MARPTGRSSARAQLGHALWRGVRARKGASTG